MTRHVNVGVVTLFALVLLVRGGNRNTALALFGRVVDFVERHSLINIRRQVLGENGGNRGGQGRLTVVDVSHGTDVQVGLIAVEFSSHSISI